MLRLERLWRALAWRLPRGLAYWAAVRVNSAATVYIGRSPGEVSVTEALRAWQEASDAPRA